MRPLRVRPVDEVEGAGDHPQWIGISQQRRQQGENTMTSKSQVRATRRTVVQGTAAVLAGAMPLLSACNRRGALKIGFLGPMSGRGADLGARFDLRCGRGLGHECPSRSFAGRLPALENECDGGRQRWPPPARRVAVTPPP
jgi:hypothetical protein